jgi:hypothetical protein
MLYDIEKLLLADSRFWKNILKQVCLTNDDSREKFYEEFFPDDIPDEWSLADQSKSHGSGMLALSEHFSILKWYRSWLFGYKSRLCWGYDLEIQEFLSSFDTEFIENPWEHIADKPFWKCPDMNEFIKPIIKNYVIS